MTAQAPGHSAGWRASGTTQQRRCGIPAPLLEIGTDKVDTDIPAPASGTLAEIRVAEDETVPVGTVLAVIA